MARSQASASKKANENKKLQKRKDKEQRKEARKANSGQGKSLEDMIAYVDENGNISSTPPDPSKKSTTSTDKKAKKSFDNFAAYLSTLSVERDYGKRDYSPDKIKDALRVGKLMVENLTDELCK